MLKRKTISGNNYLVNEQNEKYAKSFSNWSKESKLAKEVIKNKREYILQYIKDEPNNSFFILYGEKEIYLTDVGEQFINICQQVTENKYKKKITTKKNTVEQLATEKEDVKDLNKEGEKMMRLFAEMSLETDNPFSINKSFYNPFNKDKRVFYDLYRYFENHHEFYIIMATKVTLGSLFRYVVNSGKFGALIKLFSDKSEKLKIIVVAPNYDDNEKDLIEHSFPYINLETYNKMFNKIYLEATTYYKKTDLLYKLERWENDYPQFFQTEKKQLELAI